MLGPTSKLKSSKEVIDDEITLHDIFNVVRRILVEWPYLLISGLVGAIIALVINVFLLDSYQITSQVYIEVAENPLASAESILNRQFRGQSNVVLGTRMAVLGSFAHNERVARSLGWEASWEVKGPLINKPTVLPKGYSIELDHDLPVACNYPVELKFGTTGFAWSSRSQNRVHLYDFKSGEWIEFKDIQGNEMRTVPYGQWVDELYGRWRIIKEPEAAPLEEKYMLRFKSYQEIAAWGRENMHVSADDKAQSNLLTLTMKGPVRSLLVEYVNASIEELQRYELQQKNRIALNTVEFIDGQLLETENSLKSSEQALEEFRSENLIVDLSAESSQILEYMIELEQERAALQLQRSFYRYVLEFLQKKQSYSGLSLPSLSNFDNPLVVQLTEQLVQSSVELERFRYSLDGSNPAVIELEREVEYTKQALLNATRNALGSSEIVLKDLLGRITNAQGKISRLPATEQRLINIQRSYEISGGQYQMLLERRAEAGILQASNLADTKVIDPAVDRGQPSVGPDKKLHLLLGFMVGVMICAGFYLLKDTLNRRVQSPEDLEGKTDIPVIGIVPHTDHPSNLIVLEEPNSVVAESFRGLRVNLRYLLHHKKDTLGTVLAITSSISSEGKTFIAKNLASVLSLGKDSVILVEMDLRKPKIFYDFKLEKDLALKDYLAGHATERDIIQTTNFPNLDVISASVSPPNPAELLQNERFEDLLCSLRKQYKYIVLDTPPIALVADALQIMPFVDATLYVARAGVTPIELLGVAENHYQKGFLSNVGMVFNDAKKSKAYSYGYQYSQSFYGA